MEASLDEAGVTDDAEAIASAVADVMDANNQEIFRQLREVVEVVEVAEASLAAPPPDRIDGGEEP